ncbi:MAG: alpha/beta hydrolase [Oscillibacter sp.]|nr:alpha/beta hydrolase [Oscillibacter sp.]MCI8690634.1 alpha/beta hydrolase [Oscillibacter sp.]
MKTERLQIQGIPAVIYGEDSEKVWLYVHGKQSAKEAAGRFAETVCAKGWQVLSADLPEHGERSGGPVPLDPWHAVPELREIFAWASRRWGRRALRCTSLGTWFSLLALEGEPLERALFVSPVLDMELLILDMMQWAGISEESLEAAGELPTDLGETLSWEYLQYARTYKIEDWDTPTSILYAGGDTLIRREAVEYFARRFGAELTVMENGEHWFHTPEQVAFLRRWEAARGTP